MFSQLENISVVQFQIPVIVKRKNLASKRRTSTSKYQGLLRAKLNTKNGHQIGTPAVLADMRKQGNRATQEARRTTITKRCVKWHVRLGSKNDFFIFNVNNNKIYYSPKNMCHMAFFKGTSKTSAGQFLMPPIKRKMLESCLLTVAGWD